MYTEESITEAVAKDPSVNATLLSLSPPSQSNSQLNEQQQKQQQSSKVPTVSLARASVLASTMATSQEAAATAAKGNPFNVPVPFLYQELGTWGQLLFPKQWKRFWEFYDNRKTFGPPPLLKGTVSEAWYTKLGERIWSPYHQTWAFETGMFLLVYGQL